MTAVASSPSAKSARLGLRATPEQEAVLRRAAEVAHKSLTDFILDSTCLVRSVAAMLVQMTHTVELLYESSTFGTRVDVARGRTAGNAGRGCGADAEAL